MSRNWHERLNFSWITIKKGRPWRSTPAGVSKKCFPEMGRCKSTLTSIPDWVREMSVGAFSRPLPTSNGREIIVSCRQNVLFRKMRAL